MEKSYNPFKMWGSWAGFGVGIVSFVLMFFGSSGPARDLAEFTLYANPLNWLPWNSFSSGEEGAILGSLVVLATPMFLFLYGWGIHSLFRKFSK